MVSGEATVQKGTELITLRANQSIYIDVGEKHRLENHTDHELIVIEVQTGVILVRMTLFVTMMNMSANRNLSKK